MILMIIIVLYCSISIHMPIIIIYKTIKQIHNWATTFEENDTAGII